MLRIDYPGNICLRIYEAISANPAYFNFGWQVLFIAFVMVLTGVTVCNIEKKNATQQFARRVKWLFSDNAYIVLVCIGIILFRLPNLLLPEQNIDESEWIATAASYQSGSILWKTIHGHTSGPLVFIPLNVVILFGGGLNYTSIRLFGLLFCIIPSIFMVWRTLLLLFGTFTARVSIIPLFILFASANHNDLIAYNSEHVPMLLLSFCIFFLFSFSYASEISIGKLLGLGFILGLIPYAKLQAVPIGFCIGAVALVKIWMIDKRNYKEKILYASILLGSSIIGSVLVLIYLTLNNGIAAFWTNYIQMNWFYTQAGIIEGPPQTKGLSKILLLPYLVLRTYNQTNNVLLFILTEISLLCIIAAFTFRNLNLSALFCNKTLIQAFLILLSAYVAVITPGNKFLHYIILFIIPFSVFTGIIIGLMLLEKNSLAGKFVTFRLIYCFCIVFFALLSFRIPNRGIQFIATGGNYELHEVSKTILKYAHPNERMAIWGYATYFYVETGLIPANSTPTPFYPMTLSKSDNKLMNDYIDELIVNKPVVFLDNVFFNAFLFQREEFEYENYSGLKEFISNNYQQVAEVKGRVIYVLKSRVIEMNNNR